MSVESATAFKGLVEQDAGLQTDVQSRYESGGMVGVAELAAGRGYSFTEADAIAALTAAAPPDGELSDMELDAVAGGKGSNIARFSNIAGANALSGPLTNRGIIIVSGRGIRLSGS